MPIAGILGVISIITAVLPLVQQGYELIKRAQDEGRDVTPEELAAYQNATDTLFNSVMAALDAAAQQED